MTIISMSVIGQHHLKIKIDSTIFKSSDSCHALPIILDQDATVLGLQLQFNIGGAFYITEIIEGELTNLDFQIVSDSLVNLLWSDRIGIGVLLNKGDTLCSLNMIPLNKDNNTCSFVSLSDGLRATAILSIDNFIESDVLLFADPFCFISNINTSIATIDNNCQGGRCGQITVDISGGLPPYDIEWTNSGGEIIATSTSFLDNLFADNYQFAITDDCGSRIIDTIEILDGHPLTISALTIDNLCAQDSTGNIQLSLEADHDVISIIRWEHGDTSATLTALVGGQYPVEVTSVKGCSVRDTITLNDPLPLTATITTTLATCEACSDGQLEIDVQGGVPPYDIIITDELDREVSPDNLLPGPYTISIVDSNLCIQELGANINVLISDIANFETINLISPNKDGANDVLNFRQLEDYPDNTLTVFNRWGLKVFYATGYQQIGTTTFDGNYKGRPLPEGNYYYVLEIDRFDKPIKNTLLLIR